MFKNVLVTKISAFGTVVVVVVVGTGPDALFDTHGTK